MDPPIISESSFSVANPSSYTLSEIWPFPINTAGGLGPGLAGNGERPGPPADESTVTDQSGGGGRKRRYLSSEDESSKIVSTTTNSANDLNGSNGKRMKLSGGKTENGGSKSETEASSAGGTKSTEPTAKREPPKDYIHVRARRGQATDSHSLAERARREKISERMKILQDLVPGCNKVIGKAIVLDEIINYIQSLQRQVEFLSMKLEAVNSRITVNPPIEDFHSKDPFDESRTMFPPRAAPAEFVQGSQSEWLHMQVGGSYERQT